MSHTDTNTTQHAKLNGSMPADQMTKRELIAMEVAGHAWNCISGDTAYDIAVKLSVEAGVAIADALLQELEATK